MQLEAAHHHLPYHKGLDNVLLKVGECLSSPQGWFTRKMGKQIGFSHSHVHQLFHHSWTWHEGREGLGFRAEYVGKEGPGCSFSLTKCTLLRREVCWGIYYTLLLVNLGVATMQDHLFHPCHTLGENCKVN